jgi:hypothetical protein
MNSMKIKIFFCFLLLAILITPSCSIQKRKYTSGYYTTWNNSFSDRFTSSSKNNTSPTAADETPAADLQNSTASISSKEIYIDKQKPFKKNISIDDKCDVLILKSGAEIETKVIEINDKEIKYKKCNYLEGPTIVINKAEVFMIKYANGTKEMISEAPGTKTEEPGDYVNTNPKPIEKEKKMERLGFIGFLLSLTGLIFAGIPLGSLGILFGIFSLTKIKRHPEKYKNKKGFAIASIIIGGVAIIASIFLILLMV